MRRPVIVAFALAMITTVSAMAQQMADTSFVESARAEAAKRYNDFISIHSGLINGIEYRDPAYNEQEHPFYKQTDWLPGSVVYNGHHYENVSLMYDLSTDNLIVENPINGQEIQLTKVRVSEFTLADQRFRYLKAEDNAGLPQTGFYEIAYDGNSQVLIHYHKLYEEKIEEHKLVYYYRPRNRIYIRSRDAYVRVSRKRDLLKVMDDQKSPVRQFIRQNKIKVSRHNPGSFALVASHYDTIRNTK